MLDAPLREGVLVAGALDAWVVLVLTVCSWGPRTVGVLSRGTLLRPVSRAHRRRVPTVSRPAVGAGAWHSPDRERPDDTRRPRRRHRRLPDVISAIGSPGVGLLTLVETVVPPIPSEVVLPLAGFLAQQGELSLVGVVLAATLGSLAGALAFYALGARLGLERAVRVLSRVPLLDREDLEEASDWFARHGRGSVFFGRFVPGVRSLVSLPAGAQRMDLLTFVLATTAGSALWNCLLIGAGYALGTQWQAVGRYVGVASDVVLVGLAVLAVVLLVRRARRRTARRRSEQQHP